MCAYRMRQTASSNTAYLPGSALRRVQVLFGQHVIACYVAAPALADRYEVAMRRRFPVCRVTNEPLDSTRVGRS
jgi:hypothetical protein